MIACVSKYSGLRFLEARKSDEAHCPTAGSCSPDLRAPQASPSPSWSTTCNGKNAGKLDFRTGMGYNCKP